MPLWLQHRLVLLLVAGCVAWVAWQGLQSLRGRASRIGSCCAKGCNPTEPAETDKPATAPTSGEKIVFLPVESLTARARRNTR
jgi:hypothetical protein